MIPNAEYELVDGVQTGRMRLRQFRPTPRYLAVPPSQRESVLFTFPAEVTVEKRGDDRR